MEKVTEDKEEFNYENALGKIIMIWTYQRPTPFHGQLFRYSDYHIMIKNRNGYNIILPKDEIFHIELTFKSKKSLQDTEI